MILARQRVQRTAVTPTCMTLMGRPVSFANCSLMCLVGFGVDEKAVFRISSCFAFMVVLGPRRFEPAPPSPLPPPAPPSGLLFSVWLSLVSGSPSREPSTDRSRSAASQSHERQRLEPIRRGAAIEKLDVGRKSGCRSSETNPGVPSRVSILDLDLRDSRTGP